MLENVAVVARSKTIVPKTVPVCVYGKKSEKPHAAWMSPAAGGAVRADQDIT